MCRRGFCVMRSRRALELFALGNISHNPWGSNATKGNVESLPLFPIVIVVRPTMDICININTIVVIPQLWTLF